MNYTQFEYFGSGRFPSLPVVYFDYCEEDLHMKKFKLALLLLLATLTLTVLAPTTASAARQAPTIPSALRGTWYLWNKKNHQRLKITRHSFRLSTYRHGKYKTVVAVDGNKWLSKTTSYLTFSAPSSKRGFWYLGQNSGGADLHLKRTTHKHQAAIARQIDVVDDDVNTSAHTVYYTHKK